MGNATKHKRLFTGFTLAELLIALAVLGVIATFTIPKLLQNQQDSKCKAVLKETISAISQAMSVGETDGSISGSNIYAYFLSQFNYTKTCTNSLSQGCWTASQASSTETGQPGFIFASGAQVIGFDNSISTSTGITVDCDGANGANAFGVDTLYLYICMKTSGTCGSLYPAGFKDGPGSIGPWSGSTAANAQLFQDLFK